MRRLLVVLACIIQVMDASPACADALSEIAKCTGIANPSDRLKCFDAAAGREGFGLPPPREQATKAEDFGKPPPPPPPPEVRAISATVLEFARTARGRALFVLDNGQTWRQIDADGTRVDEPRPGEAMKVTIALGVLGSYNLAIDGRNVSVKVRRVK
jgi:hypothetical protein